jgi:fused signal recognition particle receptor
MFGSNDDKKTPAPGTTPVVPPSAEKVAEKKDLFGWLRKKPQEPASSPAPEPAEATPAPESQVPEPTLPQAEETAAPLVEPVAPVTPPAEPAGAAPSVSAAEPVQTPRPSRFRINAGSEVLHPVIHAPEPEPVAPLVPEAPVAEVQVEQNKPGDNQGGWFARLKQGLSKTSASLGEGMASLFLGKKAIDDELLEDIETRLLTADVGVEATTAIVQNLTRRVARKELADSGALYKALQEELTALLRPVEQPLQIDTGKQPYVPCVPGRRRAVESLDVQYKSKLNRDVPVAKPGEFAPLMIGRRAISPPVVLAPMAGVTNYPFRALCRRYGAGLFVSEMITARPLVEGVEKTLKLADFGPDESPRSLQLYGVDPHYVGRAVERLVGGWPPARR